MDAKVKRIALYAGGLFLVAVVVLGWYAWQFPAHWPAWYVFVAFAAAGLLILLGSFPAPVLGTVSLDRIYQVGTILIFGPVPAACLNALISLVWPFLDRSRRAAGRRFALIRGFHNAGMFILVILGAGAVYQGLGGDVPLRSLSPRDSVLLIVLALCVQLFNDAFMAVIGKLNGKRWLEILSPALMLFELAAVPVGVFTAYLYNSFPLGAFLLFVVLMGALVYVVRGFAVMRRQLEHRVEHLLAINRITRAIGTSRVLDDVVEMMFAECRKLFTFSAFYLVLHDADHQELDFRLHHNEQGRQPRKRKAAGEGVLGWIVENNRPVFIQDWAKADPDVRRRVVIVGETAHTFMGVPITYGDQVLGVISLQSYRPEAFSESDFDLLQTFAGQAAIAIANARMYAQLEEYQQQLEFKVAERTRELNRQKQELMTLSESLTVANKDKQILLDKLERETKEDSLTGLFNRRFMDERLATELRRAERFDRNLSVAMADLDHFKLINDERSHLVGDEVLRQVADILRRQCRAIDVISRHGGEEFLLCFPETDIEGARDVCEKIRAAVSAYDWDAIDPGLSVTISIGLAAAPPVYQRDALLARADAKLYEAKRAGRDRVAV